MIDSGFINVVHGLLSLHLRVEGHHAFAIEHPYQQNIRMAEAALEKNEVLARGPEHCRSVFSCPIAGRCELKRTGPELRLRQT